MDDFISRAAAIDALTDTNLKRNVDSVCDGDMNRTRRAAQRVIAQLPALDAAPVTHGQWTHYLCVGHDMYKCSECSHWIIAGIDRNYCPNCGAKMESEYDMSKSNKTTIGHWLDGSDDLPPIGGFHD